MGRKIKNIKIQLNNRVNDLLRVGQKKSRMTRPMRTVRKAYIPSKLLIHTGKLQICLQIT